MTTWKKLLVAAMEKHGEKLEDAVSMVGEGAKPGSVSATSWLNKRFDDGFGACQGPSFTVWTERRVYFPVCYDGAEWVASAARFPDGKPTDHVGGH